MKLKKISRSVLSLMILLNLNSANALVITPNTQVIYINTNFRHFYGNPTWLLIVRDMKTGQVLPYLYDIKNNDNFWIAFTGGRSYRITASSLKFGPYAKINNFCNLENGTIEAESYNIRLVGDLSPDPHSFKCMVSKYKNNMPFTITEEMAPVLETTITKIVNPPSGGGGSFAISPGGGGAKGSGSAPAGGGGGGGGAKPPPPVQDTPLPKTPFDTSPSAQGILIAPQNKQIITGSVH